MNLRDLPWSDVFATYPYADQISDAELIRRLYRAKKSSHEASASRMLRALGRQSVWRGVDRDPIEGHPGPTTQRG